MISDSGASGCSGVLGRAVLPCAVQAECGGCPLMPLSGAEQRAHKHAMLEACMRRAGVNVDRTAIGFTPSPRLVGYRNRIRLRIDPGGCVRFFNERKAATCVVLEPGLVDRIAFVLELSGRSPELFAPFQHLELRSDDDLGRPGLALGGAGPAPPLDGFLTGVRGDPDIASQKRTILEDVWTFAPLDGFLQVNAAVNAALVTAVREGARARGAASVLDLFAGSGNFSLPLAVDGLRVSAVEMHAPSARALAEAARAQGRDVTAIAEPARDACARLAAARCEFDVVIVDAPRAGARDTLPAVFGVNPSTVVLCSCNVETLARDAAELVAAGFQLQDVHLFDMFPNTHHVEALAWFGR